MGCKQIGHFGSRCYMPRVRSAEDSMAGVHKYEAFHTVVLPSVMASLCLSVDRELNPPNYAPVRLDSLVSLKPIS